MKLKGDKCKFCDTCKWYSKKSVTCNRDGGDYYGYGRPAGCYVENSKNQAESSLEDLKKVRYSRVA